MEVATERKHKTHVVKCWPEFFEAIMNGEKTFDLRRYDRDYQVGDDMVQEEYKPHIGTYTGREFRCRINYILRGEKFQTFGLMPGFACLGISLVK